MAEEPEAALKSGFDSRPVLSLRVLFPVFFILIWQTPAKALGLCCPVYAVLLQLALCDSFYYTLQDQWSLFISLAGLLWKALSFACSGASGYHLLLSDIRMSLGGAIFVFILWILTAFISAAAKKDSPLGMGDAKLLAAASLLVSQEGLIQTAVFAFLASGLWAIILVLTGKAEQRDQIAFGPFICLGIISYLWSTSYI